METSGPDQTDAPEFNMQTVGPKNSGFAVVSFTFSVMAIASCLGGLYIGPIAIVTGIIALVQIRNSRPQYRGKGLAIAGIVLGAISLTTATTMLDLRYRSREKIRYSVCMSNLKGICTSMASYAQDNEGHLPPPERWNEAVMHYARTPDTASKGLICPSAGSHEPGYAMNARFGGYTTSQVRDPNVPIVFDSIPGPNMSGGHELLPEDPRHSSGDVYGFLDGHAKLFLRAASESMNWDPGASQ